VVIDVVVHAPAPPRGSADAIALPEMSPATHSWAEGQEMEIIPVPASTDVTAQSEATPVGLLEVATRPPQSAATQNVDDGQEIDEKTEMPGIPTSVQVPAPPDGFVVFQMWLFSTATHSATEGHEMARIG
jgi:hypothetical protein